MKKYRYEAVDPKGNNVEGTMPCDTFEEVVYKLLKEQHYPTRIEELNPHRTFVYGRLDNMRAIRDRLQLKKVEAPVIAPRPSRRLSLFAVLVVFWLVAVVLYIIATQTGGS
jgi:hypothetical protein